jgi:hypothetical protein
VLITNFRAIQEGLRPHPVEQVRALYPSRKPGVVMGNRNIVRSAGSIVKDRHRKMITRQINGSRQSGWSASDDDAVFCRKVHGIIHSRENGPCAVAVVLGNNKG